MKKRFNLDIIVPTGNSSSSINTCSIMVVKNQETTQVIHVPSGTTLNKEQEKLEPTIQFTGEHLGFGSGGYVRKARHIITNIPLAIKTIKIDTKEKRAQLLSDIQAYQALPSSNNLIHYYGSYIVDNEMNIVLEYMDLGSLDKLLAKLKDSTKKSSPLSQPSSPSPVLEPLSGPESLSGRDVTRQKKNGQKREERLMPENIIAYIAYELLQGISFLHQHNIVHRDIKPGNILLNSQGEIKLSDFGLAKFVQSNNNLITFIGTSTYMAPERIMGEPYGFPVDIWSLGLVIGELLLGRNVIGSGGSFVELMMRITSSDLELPEYVWDSFLGRFLSVGADIREFVHSMLKRSPEDRPSIQELLDMNFIKNRATQTQFQLWLGHAYKA